MEDNIEIEELFEDEELEAIEKYARKWDIPAICVCESTIYFTSSSLEIIPERIRWFTTSSLVIGLPACEADVDGFKVRRSEKHQGVTTHFPTALKRKKVKLGTYKIYKYKDGFAFKRYEPIMLRKGYSSGGNTEGS